MEQTSHDISMAINRIKLGSGSSFITNLYVPAERIQVWMNRAEAEVDEMDNLVFLFRQDRGFRHLYFAARDKQALEDGLKRQGLSEAEPLMLDLVGSSSQVSGLTDVFIRSGFRSYQKLFRMRRMAVQEVGHNEASDYRVSSATKNDAPDILAMLLSAFDCRAEQVPFLYEIEQAASLGQWLVVREGHSIAGMLFFETTGVSSTLRYWLVAEGFRGRQVGSALLRRWFFDHPQVKRFLLWVLEGNARTIDKYRHYGFEPDGLVDVVLANLRISA